MKNKNNNFNFKEFVRNEGLKRLNKKRNSIIVESAITPQGKYAQKANKKKKLKKKPPPGVLYFVNDELKKAIVSDLEKSLKKFPKPKIIDDAKAKGYAKELYNAMIGSSGVEYYTRMIGVGLGTDKDAVERTLNNIPTSIDLSKVADAFKKNYGGSWSYDDELINVLMDEFGTVDFNSYVQQPIKIKQKSKFIKLGSNKPIGYEEFQKAMASAGDDSEDVDVGGKAQGKTIKALVSNIVTQANNAYEEEIKNIETHDLDSTAFTDPELYKSLVPGGGAVIGGGLTYAAAVRAVANAPMQFTYKPTGVKIPWNTFTPEEKTLYIAAQRALYPGRVAMPPAGSTISVATFNAFPKPGGVLIPNMDKGILGLAQPSGFVPASVSSRLPAATPVVKNVLGQQGRRLASLGAIRQIGLGQGARLVFAGAVRGLTSPIGLLTVVWSLGDYFFNSATEEAVKDVSLSLTPDLYKEIVKTFREARKTSSQILANIKSIPVWDEEEQKALKEKEKKKEEAKKKKEEAEQEAKKKAERKARILPLSGITLDGKDLMPKIRHVMNKYVATREIKGVPLLTTSNASWDSGTDSIAWAEVARHILENHSTISKNSTSENILTTVNFTDSDSWKSMASAYRFDYPGYTADRTGMLAFLLDGYYDNTNYGKRKRATTKQSKKDPNRSKKSSGDVNVILPPTRGRPQSRYPSGGGSGVGLRPRNVTIKVFGIPGIRNLDDITPPGTAIRLKKMLVDNIKSRSRGTIIEPSETLMMIITVGKKGKLLKVRKAPGQLGDFNDFKAGTWRRWGPGVSRLHSFLARRRFNNLKGIRKFELHFTFPAGFYDQS
jgi:hypothetical protein